MNKIKENKRVDNLFPTCNSEFFLVVVSIIAKQPSFARFVLSICTSNFLKSMGIIDFIFPGLYVQVIEYLVGDGPNNRFALICSQCCSHNGMALKEEFEYTGNTQANFDLSVLIVCCAISHLFIQVKLFFSCLFMLYCTSIKLFSTVLTVF